MDNRKGIWSIKTCAIIPKGSVLEGVVEEMKGNRQSEVHQYYY